MRKIFWTYVFIILWSISVYGDASNGFFVTDMADRKVKVPFKSQRIICIGPGTLRLIVYLKAENRLVGVEDMEKRKSEGRPYWIAHPELAKLPGCGPGGPSTINKKPDMERILALNPDVVFISYMEAALADKVSTILNIPVVVLSYGELADFNQAVYDSLEIAGKVLKKEKRAEAVKEYIETVKKDLYRRSYHMKEENKPKPLIYAGGIGYRGAQGIGSTKKDFIPFNWVNAENIADKISGKEGRHLFLNKEKLLELNPAIIFIDGGGLSLVLEDYKKRPSFYNVLKAFKEKRVYTIFPYNSYTTNIDTALIDAYAIGKILYPDRFSDIVLSKKADEIYYFLVGNRVYQSMKRDYGPIGARPIS